MITCLIPLSGITIYSNRGYMPSLNSDLPGSLSRVYAHRETGHEATPAERWSYDLLEANGTARVRQVVEDVKAMCQAAQAMNA